eukprot:608622-Rhodomonas_salina.1
MACGFYQQFLVERVRVMCCHSQYNLYGSARPATVTEGHLLNVLVRGYRPHRNIGIDRLRS